VQTNAALSDLAARALSLADGERWTVAAQATDGTLVPLRIGRPGRTLVLYLSQEARDADADRARPAPPATPTPCPPVPLLPLPPLSPEGTNHV